MLFEKIEHLIKLFSNPPLYQVNGQRKTLAEIIGFSPMARLLIVNADDFGLCQSVNGAVRNLIKSGYLSSVSVIAGSAGFDEAIAIAKDLNFPCGIHLTLSSEWQGNDIKPVLPANAVGSLLDESGQLFSEIRDLYAHAKLEEVESECQAQMEKVINTGIMVDHLDAHMGALQLNPDYIRIYYRLAKDYNLPIRMGSENLAKLMGLPAEFIHEAANQGLVFPDNLIYIPMSFARDKDKRFAAYDYSIKNIPHGITEIYFHPSLSGPDFEALSHRYSNRKEMSYESIRLWDYEYLSSGRLSRLINKENISMIGYNELKRLISYA